MNKVFFLIIIGLFLVGSAAYICIDMQNDNDAVKRIKNNTKELKDNVYNPATGERWNSVEEYIHRERFAGPVKNGYDVEHFRNTGEMIIGGKD